MRVAVTLAQLVVSAAVLGSAVGAKAQDAALSRVEELMSEGRFGSARDELQAWIGGSWDGAGREDRQRSLWLRGRLTVDAGMAELDFRRLVVEYPGGTFSDGALLRLAELARARGDDGRARQYVQMLIRDYPQSAYRAQAVDLMGRISDSPPAEVPAAPQTTMPAPMPAPDSGPAATGAALPSPDDRGSGLPPSGPVEFDGMPFAIEMGAFSTEEPARAIVDAATAAGVEIRVVGLRGSDLIHIRTGAFFSQMEAEARALALRLQGLPAAVTTDREDEEPR